MNRLTCEMCNSTDVIKQDGFFVCQSCGTKYSVEEAKKMMIEGTVDVSGSTVKVDDSVQVKQYLSSARKAKEKDDWEECEKYYKLYEQSDPTNIEAIFYGAYAKLRASFNDGDFFKREANFKILCNCLSLIDKNYIVKNENEEIPLLEQITDDICSLTYTSFVYTEKKDIYGTVTETNKSKTTGWFSTVLFCYRTTLYNILNMYATNISSDESVDDDYDDEELSEIHDSNEYNTNDYDTVIKIYFMILKTHEYEKKYLSRIPQIDNDYILKLHKKIQQLDPSHEIPELETFKEYLSKSSGGCYVATCVYGSYDCPEVWTLRRYRDYKLDTTWYGRIFIKTYYAISPTIVKWFGNTNWFKKLWKGKLDRMVSKLQEHGYESTRYNDKY